jgi:predicted nucleic acid-binding protein
VLTRLPVKPLITPELAQRLIIENLRQFEVILLDQPDYEQAIAQMVRLKLSGGGIYDALIAQAFVKANCDRLFTLNPKHFTRLGDAIAQRTQTPT